MTQYSSGGLLLVINVVAVAGTHFRITWPALSIGSGPVTLKAASPEHKRAICTVPCCNPENSLHDCSDPWRECLIDGIILSSVINAVQTMPLVPRCVTVLHFPVHIVRKRRKCACRWWVCFWHFLCDQSGHLGVCGLHGSLCNQPGNENLQVSTVQTHACSLCICIDLSTTSMFTSVFIHHRVGLTGTATNLCRHFAVPATRYWLLSV